MQVKNSAVAGENTGICTVLLLDIIFDIGFDINSTILFICTQKS